MIHKFLTAFFMTGLVFTFPTTISSQPRSIVYKVNADDTRDCCSTKNKMIQLPPIYCYPGSEKSVLNVFQTITVDLTIGKTEEFIVYQGIDYHVVEEQMFSDENKLNFKNFKSYLWRQKYFKLDPFEQTCFSIKTNANFKIKIRSISLDHRRLGMFIVGLFLFEYSARLSHNFLSYYLCGIIIGVTASFVIIILLISRLILKKKNIVVYFVASCVLSLYAIQMIIENINMILILYYKYIMGYIIFSMLVSFVVCYRYGSVTNTKYIDLIRWMLQLLGLALVTSCSFHIEAMVFVNILIIIFYYKNFSLCFRFLSKCKQKPQLLTEKEFVQQSLIETPKALEELRKYCNSPDCDTWKIVTRLHNPKLFADFMETSAHVPIEVIRKYENGFYDCDTESVNNSSDDSNELHIYL